jgi:hypothetical protein
MNPLFMNRTNEINGFHYRVTALFFFASLHAYTISFGRIAEQVKQHK